MKIFSSFCTYRWISQVNYEKKEEFKVSMSDKKLSFGWDNQQKSWFTMTTDPDLLAAIVAEGWELLPNPNEE